MNKEIVVLGAGNQGLALSSHLALAGEKVNLWNRSANHISHILQNKTIEVTGTLNGTAILNKVSTEICEVLSSLIFVTVPTDAHNSIAEMLAPYIHDSTVIILTPGRTFGAINFLSKLKEYGCNHTPIIFETQTIIHTARKIDENHVCIYALKKDVEISCLSKDVDINTVIPVSLQKYYLYEPNVLKTSLGNVGMVLHCTPTMLNVGCIESEKISFKYYFDGISPTIAKFIEKIDNERLLLGKYFGIELESVEEWMKRTYSIVGNGLYDTIHNNHSYSEIEAPHTANHRYLFEDIPNGLVPLEYLSKQLGLDCRYTTAVIDFASLLMNTDFRDLGRKYSIESIRDYLK